MVLTLNKCSVYIKYLFEETGSSFDISDLEEINQKLRQAFVLDRLFAFLNNYSKEQFVFTFIYTKFEL